MDSHRSGAGRPCYLWQEGWRTEEAGSNPQPGPPEGQAAEAQEAEATEDEVEAEEILDEPSDLFVARLEAVAPHIVCTTCSFMLPVNAKFCGNCGANLEGDPNKPQISERGHRQCPSAGHLAGRLHSSAAVAVALPRPHADGSRELDPLCQQDEQASPQKRVRGLPRPLPPR